MKHIDKDQLHQLYIVEAKSARDIGKILDMSYRTVINKLKNHGIPARSRIEAVKVGTKKKLKKVILRDQLYELYVVQNKTTRDVAKEFNTSHVTIIANLRDYNIPVRTQSECMTGRKHTKEHKEKIAASQRGEKSHHWRGGKTKVANSIRRSAKYADWRLQCLKRDAYTCQHCGKQPGRLHVDHLKPFAIILEEQNITTTDEAVACEELWDLSNGQALCIPCHQKTGTWGYKTTKQLIK